MPLVGLGGADPLVRLVRLQPRLHPGRDRRALRRGRDRDEPRRSGRRARRDGHDLPAHAHLGHRHDRQRRDRRTGRDHGALRLRRVLGRAADRRDRRADRRRRRDPDRPLVDDPVGALSAHGLAGIWGTLSCGLFTAPRLAEYNAIGEGGLVYTGSFEQLGVQALGVAAAFASVFVVSFVVFFADQGHLRPAGEARGGALRPRHRRARHVGLPGAVHAGARLRVPPAGAAGAAADAATGADRAVSAARRAEAR